MKKYLFQIIMAVLCSANVVAVNFHVLVQQDKPSLQNMAGASVVLNVPNGQPISQNTDSNGIAAFGDLPLGTYSLVVSKDDRHFSSGAFMVGQPVGPVFTFNAVIENVSLEDLNPSDEELDALGSAMASGLLDILSDFEGGTAEDARLLCNGQSGTCDLNGLDTATINWQGNPGATGCVLRDGSGAVIGTGISGSVNVPVD